MSKWRIVEVCPSVFVVQYKCLGIFWLQFGRDYNTSLESARMNLANSKLVRDWKPVVHKECK